MSKPQYGKNFLFTINDYYKKYDVAYFTRRNRCDKRLVHYSNGKVYPIGKKGPELNNEISPKMINSDGRVQFKNRKRFVVREA